jgi:hypothetical protein
MSWSDELDDLLFTADNILDEDLAGLQRMPDRRRIELYNEIESDQQEFSWEFKREHGDQLSSSEIGRIEGRFTLAQLLLAASFYKDGDVPKPLDEKFVEPELQAVADYDRYKLFDALDEDQIAEKIRRMEGEVYELTTEYTSTQLADMDEMLDNPDVQQDVMERLADRYDDRREKVRHGFFVYVEAHGIEKMVEAIEDAVTAVNKSRDEREEIRETLQQELADLEQSLDERVREQRRQLEQEVRSVERDLASRSVSADELDDRLDRLAEETGGLSDAQAEALEELTDRIDHTSELEGRLEQRIDQLEQVREEAAEADREAAREEASDLVEEELSALRDQRDELRGEIDRLQREREGMEAAADSLDERREDLEDRVESIEQSVETTAEGDGEGIEAENLVTSTIARLLELDYLGRFDTTMHGTERLHTPDGEFEAPDGYWDGRGERRSEEPRLADLLAESGPEAGADPDAGAGTANSPSGSPRTDAHPANRRARYWLTDTRHMGLTRETKLVVEAVVYSHLEAHAENGFDTRPIDLDDLIGLVNDTVGRAEGAEQHHLVAVASPTGFTDRALAELGGDRSRFSRYLSLVLVDLRSGELHYDERDELASANERLFDLELDEERVAACVDRIRDIAEDPATTSVLVDDLAGEFDSHVVKRAFDRLEADGLGTQLYVDEFGLGLHFD